MSGRNWARKTIRPLSCVPRKLVWPSTPPMPLSTPSAANRSLNPWGSRESPSPSWYARRTTARFSFSRLVRWRLVSGSLDRSLALKPAVTFVRSAGLVACDGAAPIARARLAAAAKAVIVFQRRTFMFMSSCGFQNLMLTARLLPAPPSRVDLGADAEVEADRLEDDERGAGRIDVGGGQDAGVLLDNRRGRVADLRRLVLLNGGP